MINTCNNNYYAVNFMCCFRRHFFFFCICTKFKEGLACKTRRSRGVLKVMLDSVHHCGALGNTFKCPRVSPVSPVVQSTDCIATAELSRYTVYSKQRLTPYHAYTNISHANLCVSYIPSHALISCDRKKEEELE